MQSKTITTFREKSVPELQKLLLETRDRLWTRTLELRRGKVKNIRECRAIRKDVARLHMVLHEKQKSVK